jgi:branched-chain amino acid transport system permease protein
MLTLLLFAALGLGQGALIAGLATALVVTYRGSGVINLATGAIAMVAGYAFWALTSGYAAALAPLPAAAIALAVAVAVGVLVEAVAFVPLRSAPPMARVTASLGLLLVLQAAVVLVFGTPPRQPPSLLPTGTVTAGQFVVPADRFVLAGIVLVVTAAVAAAYRFSRFGLATRAVAENEQGALLAGLSPRRMSLLNAAVASSVAGLLGVVAAPIVQVDSYTLPLQMVPALAAALFARFTSLWIAAAAGLLLGACQSVVYAASTQSWFPTDQGNPLPGLQHVVVLVAIVIALLTAGSRLPGRGELNRPQLPPVPAAARLRWHAGVGAAVAAAALVVLPFDFRQATVNTIVAAVVVMSYVVLAGYVGQISVMQLALSGTAGFLLAHLTAAGPLPFPVAAGGAVLGAAALGVAVGAAALRVRGVSLAVVTLAAAVAVEQALFLNTSFGGRAGVTVDSPTLFGVDLGPGAGYRGLDGNAPSPVFGWLTLAVATGLGLYVANLRRTALGRQMLAVRSNEAAAAAAGVGVTTVKMTAVTISSLIAAVAGVLSAYNFAAVSATRFTALAALLFVALAYVGGITRVTGALLAGAMSTEALVPHALEEWFGLTGTWLLLISGILLVLTLILHPGGITGIRAAARPASGSGTPPAEGRSDSGPGSPPAAGPIDGGPTAPAPAPGAAPALSTRGLTVRFGGVRALIEVDLDVAPGEIVGLIGPNGAGKTTFVDAVCGFTPSRGEVLLDDTDVTGEPPHRRARRGLHRTWQSVELFDDLTVAENAAVSAPRRWYTLVAETFRGPARPDEGAARALRLLGLEPLAGALPGTLAHGQRRLAAVARTLAASPRVICLDEPASGLSVDETRELGRHLRTVARDGAAVVLVDHDMGFVLGTCDRIVVLDLGRVVAAGTADQIRSDPVVHAAYLGTGSVRPAVPQPVRPS